MNLENLQYRLVNFTGLLALDRISRFYLEADTQYIFFKIKGRFAIRLVISASKLSTIFLL